MVKAFYSISGGHYITPKDVDLSKDLQINATEIQSLSKGDKLIAKNGVEIIDPKGIIIKGDEAEYDKIKSKIKVKYNVEINALIASFEIKQIIDIQKKKMY